MRLKTSLTKFAAAAIFNFIPTSKFISIHSPFIYKVSKIRFVHDLCFRAFFLGNAHFTLISRDTLQKKCSTE